MKFDVYSDGSYSSKTNSSISTGGVIIVDNNNNIVSARHIKLTEPVVVKTRNAGAEVIAALTGIMDIIKYCNGNDCVINLYYDYEGVKKFYTGEFKANNALMEQYSLTLKRLLQNNKNIKLFFHKVKSHSGCYYNELVDLLAKTGDIPNLDRSLMKETIVI